MHAVIDFDVGFRIFNFFDFYFGHCAPPRALIVELES